MYKKFDSYDAFKNYFDHWFNIDDSDRIMTDFAPLEFYWKCFGNKGICFCDPSNEITNEDNIALVFTCVHRGVIVEWELIKSISHIFDDNWTGSCWENIPIKKWTVLNEKH